MNEKLSRQIRGSDYKVEVYNSLEYMDEWSIGKHAFELREGENLIKLDHLVQSLVVKLTSKHGCLTTGKIYSLWESIYDVLPRLPRHIDFL